MRLTVRKAGILSTVQDNGRYGYLAQAVPVSGTMDKLAARLANMAVGNAMQAAVIEFTYSGDRLIAETELLMAYSGRGAFFECAGQKLPINKPIFIPQEAELVLVRDISNKGGRVYLAIAGGLDVPEILDSKSTCLMAGFGGLNGKPLRSDDVLIGCDNGGRLTQNIMESLRGTAVNYPKWQISEMGLRSPEDVIRVVPGNEFTWFNGLSITNFLTESFCLANQSNRMGYRLKGPVMKRTNNTELLSTAVTPGTIQVTNDGSLIMLMADCQTTGGYTRIAQVADVDMPLCGQLMPGDDINFTTISWSEAENLYIEREMLLNKIAIGIKNKYL